MQATVHISRGGRLVIPADVRRALNLKEGTALILEVEGAGFRLTPVDEIIDRLQDMAAAMLKDAPSLADELTAERRRDALRELEEGATVE